jgi:hypothetical protein
MRCCLKFNYGLSLAVLIAFVFAGCAGPASRSSPDQNDVWQLSLPPECVNGTASRERVLAWFKPGMDSEYADANPQLDLVEEDLNRDGLPELLLGDRHMYGTGGPFYFVFLHTPSGYRYFGILSGGFRVLPKETSTDPEIVTSWHMSAEESTVTLIAVRPGGFHQLAQFESKGCDEGDEIIADLFDSKTVSPQTLKKYFGANLRL